MNNKSNVIYVDFRKSNKIYLNSNQSRSLLKDEQYLKEKLKISKEHFELCEKYGCKGLWKKEDIL